MQQEELSILSGIIWVGKKMPLEFGKDFCTPREPIAWIWRKGNDPIGCRPTAIIVVVDVHLPEIHAISLVHEILT